MAYQAVPGTMYAQVPMIMAGPSFGITSTPNPGWDCCNMPPCVCCGYPVYFADNHKTWGETGEWKFPCCGCGQWRVDNARVNPGGAQYNYQYERACCSNDGALIVSRQGVEIGRLLTHAYCCPCDKTLINAIDTTGKSHYTLRTRPFSCCDDGCYCGCFGCGPCCVKRPCCATWGRYDNLFISGPEGTPIDPKPVHATVQYNACCPNWYPWWYGYDTPPAVAEDERALLLGFLILRLAFPHAYNYQLPNISALPPTLGHRLQ